MGKLRHGGLAVSAARPSRPQTLPQTDPLASSPQITVTSHQTRRCCLTRPRRRQAEADAVPKRPHPRVSDQHLLLAARMAPVRAPLVMEFQGSSFPRTWTILQSIVENRPPQTAKLPVVFENKQHKFHLFILHLKCRRKN